MGVVKEVGSGQTFKMGMRVVGNIGRNEVQ